jgi:hypothetical protein
MILGHKRLRNPRLLMLGATPALLGAPILRLILLATHLEFPTAIIVGFVVLDMFFVPCFAYDLVIRGRIHRAYTYALTLFVVSEITLSNLPAWGPWLHFSRSLQQLLSSTGF